MADIIYGSTKVANDDLWHIGFRNKTLCGQDEVATARGLIEATCPKCVAMYKQIMNLDDSDASEDKVGIQIDFSESINQIINTELDRQHEKYGGRLTADFSWWIVNLVSVLGDVSKSRIRQDTLALIGDLTELTATAILAIEDCLYKDDDS